MAGRLDVNREALVVATATVYAEASEDSAEIAWREGGVVRLADVVEATRYSVRNDRTGRFFAIASRQDAVGYIERKYMATYDSLVIQLQRTTAGWRLAQLRHD